MKVFKPKRAKSWIKPTVTLSYSEFVDGIKEAEEGVFYSVQESIQHFEQWMNSRQKR